MSDYVGHKEAVWGDQRTPPELRSTANTARLLDCSSRTVYRLVERGELVPVRVGRVLRFELDEIGRYLDRHRGASAINDDEAVRV